MSTNYLHNIQSRFLKVSILSFLLFAFGAIFSSNFALAQKMERSPTKPIVKGQIIDEQEKPIPGAAILVKGTTLGTVADINGFFSLDMSQFSNDQVLVISFVDRSIKEVKVEIDKVPKDFGQIKLKQSAKND
ncbi:carboxypeptidase-like regulatory domain-containing protein [Algoriphagus zhangzhouensis]|uniref:CarboxypepD_reg-like domain-containing protein n=1 Tax=Algoriphagus zhangzhouensis TaxID=1073327 RepID=A0A1M7Z8Z4_9BACT|nr:carboxypeptidase-like regulatory domain-containing protein [Algoriphagus zhangzhouensis]TDY47492.1 carboxypeptidase-like protein [Algoriphagus zhangzhouensis]SHO61398.1 CarboxypepD_reg-like domain-containing protein [Algoriphagus zhangzhouensis]